MTYSPRRLVPGLGSSRGVLGSRVLGRVFARVAVLAVVMGAACADAVGPNDPADAPADPVVLSNASGLSMLITEESERIIPTLRKGATSDELAERMRVLGDMLRTAGEAGVRGALNDFTSALGRYDSLVQDDPAAAAELGALRLAVDAVREALQPAR